MYIKPWEKKPSVDRRQKLTKKPKEKFEMTEREIETAESSKSPRWPTKILVKELTP